MRTNPVKRALKAGQTVIGSEVNRLRSPEIPRLYALAGLDFVFIDMEHSAFGLETVADMVQAARSADIVPIVRIPNLEYSFVSRVLDLGARGIIVPRVNTPEEVRNLMSWMRYPPHGVRGFACTPQQTDDVQVSTSAFMESVERETLCVIQIERKEALDNLEQMLAIEGVDVACLGYMDLSVDLGIPGQLDHPQMKSAIERLISVSDLYGVAPGIICPQIDAVEFWMQAGMRFVSYSADWLLLLEAVTAAARRLQALPARRIEEESTSADG